MSRAAVAALHVLAVVALAHAQQPGSVHAEHHPSLPLTLCTKAAGCAAAEATGLTLDAGRRWLHDAEKPKDGNCGSIGNWNATLCPDGAACAQNCALEGLREEDYEETYGVLSTQGGVRINYVTGESNIGSRVYLMDEHAEEYRPFRLKNREFAIDVDVSTLECGLNAAVYFVEMPINGGKGVGGNAAGAKYGLGYCDARCPHGVSFINGEANMEGEFGACCTEMDVWEANSAAASMTAHPCGVEGLQRCEGKSCGDEHDYYQGMCDKDGCEYNSFRMGNHDFLGVNKTVDTSRRLTVVTQFITEDGTDEGALVEIRRLYVQDGRVIPNPPASVAGISGSSINAELCSVEKEEFVQTRADPAGDYNQFGAKGGLDTMGQAFDRGMVLVLALWDDQAVHMEWLDAVLPESASNSTPGAVRGPCSPEWGDPAWLRRAYPEAYALFENLRFGDIGSTTPEAAEASAALVAQGTAMKASALTPAATAALRAAAAAATAPAARRAPSPVQVCVVLASMALVGAAMSRRRRSGLEGSVLLTAAADMVPE